MMGDFIIDFNRLNELTAHDNDSITNSDVYSPVFIYSLSRKVIKEYLEIFTSYNGITDRRLTTTDEYIKACDVLYYNKIIVNKADIRDGKINEVLN